MEAESIFIPRQWRRASAAVRILFALGMTAMAVQKSAGTAVVGTSVGYLLFAFLVVFWHAFQRPTMALLALVADTLAFLVSAHYIARGDTWLVLSQFAFLSLTILIAHQRQQAGIVTLMSIGYLALVDGRSQPLTALAMIGLVTLAGVSQRRILEHRLFLTSRQTVIHRAEAQNARAQERERIAEDFHDGPLQSFMSMQVRLEVARRIAEKDQRSGLQELAQLQEVWKNQVAEVRAFVRNMRAQEVVDADLPAAVSREVGMFQKDSGLAATFRSEGTVPRLAPELTTEILQMVREALNNIRKHAQAKSVGVVLAKEEGSLRLRVTDDGVGFPFAGQYSHRELELLRIGPVSVRRRVSGLHGELTVESRPGHGSTLDVRIPA